MPLLRRTALVWAVAACHTGAMTSCGERRLGRVAMLLIAAALLTACKDKGGATPSAGEGQGEAAAAATGPLVIGAYLSMTGATATFGVTSERGARMAVDEVNAGGGIRGRKLELVVLDTQGKADEAGNAVARLIDVNKAVALLGEIQSSLSLVGGRIAQRRQVPMVSPSSTNTKVTEIGDYIFRVCFIDPFQGLVMAKFAHKNLNLRKVAILKDVRSDYSIGLTDSFKAAFLALGGQIVGEESYGAGDTEFSAQLTKLKATEPDGLYVPGYYTEVGAIARQARRLGLMAPMLGGDGWESPELRNIGGQDIVGSYYSNHFAHDNPTPSAKKFIDAYGAKFHEPAPALGALAYDAVLVIVDAMKRAKDLTPPSIRDALAATQAVAAVTGTLKFDQNRNPVKPAVIVKVTSTGEAFAAEIAP